MAYGSESPRAEDIVLNPQNEALREQLLDGLERAISSDFSFTVEVEDSDWRPGFPHGPFPKSLARIAFLKLDGLSLADGVDEDSFDDDFEEEATPDSPPLFQLAVEVKGHLLDKDKAVDLTPEEIEKLGLKWPDGMRVTLLDRIYSNIHWHDFCYQPASSSFSFTGGTSGFVATETPKQKPAHMAYAIDSGMNSGAYITEDDGMDYLDDLRIINQILQKGKLDTEASARFADAAEQSGVITVLNRDIEVIRGSLPYLKRIIRGSLAASDFRDMIAWQQYCEGRWGQKRNTG